MFAGLSLKTSTPSQNPPATDAAPKPEAQPSATSSFSFMSSSMESETSANSDPSSGRSSPLAASTGGFSFINNDNNKTDETPAPPSTNGFSFMNSSNSAEEAPTAVPETSTGFSFVANSVPNETPSASKDLSTLISSPAAIPLATGVNTSATKVVKKKRASKVRVGYARDNDDDQPPAASSTTPTPPAPTPTMVNTTSSSMSVGASSISNIGSDDLPSSVMAEITAAEMLEKRLKAEQEEREIAEAIEAVAKAEAEAKAEEEAKAQLEAATAAALKAQQQPTSPSSSSSFTDKAKSWFMGSGSEPETKPSPPSTTPSTSLTKPTVQQVPVTVEPPNTQQSSEPTTSSTPPPTTQDEAPPAAAEATPVEAAPTVTTPAQAIVIPQTIQSNIETPKEVVSTPKEDVSPELPVEEANLSEELDFVLAEFVDDMEAKCGIIESSHDLVSELESKKAAIIQSHAETLQALHSLEAKQNALAEAEDYEGAEALSSVVEEHQVKVRTLQQDLSNIENQLSDLSSSLIVKRKEQEDRIASLESTLQEFESRSTLDNNDSETKQRFAVETRRLAAERERLSAERGHVGRDRKHLEDERGETEGNINSQTKEITEEAAQIKLELTGVEGDIVNLEKLLMAKKAAALELTKKLDASAAAVDAVRLKFDRQLQRIAEREVIIRRSEMECDSEELQLKKEEDKHEAALAIFNGRQAETERINQLANSERDAAASLRVSLKEMAQAKSVCHDHNDGGSSSSSIAELRAAVLEAEDRANASEVKLNEALLLVESLKEEAKACAEKIPQLEAAKKVAASAKNFKEAGALSKEAKATELKGEECRNEAAQIGASLESLESLKIECHKLAIEARQKLSEAEKELDLKKLFTLRDLAVELRHRELKAEMNLLKENSNKRNCISFGAVLLAKSEVKVIMKDINLLTSRNNIEDDWELPNELPPSDDDDDDGQGDTNDEAQVIEVVDEEGVGTKPVEEVKVEEDVKETIENDERGDDEQEELEQALRNLSGSMVNQETLGEDIKDIAQHELEDKDTKEDDNIEDDGVVVVEKHKEEEGEEEIDNEAEEQARLLQAKEEAEAKRQKEDSKNLLLYTEQVKSILVDIENLENQILEAAEDEDFDLADELQQQVYAKEEEVKVFAGLSDLHATAVEAAKTQ